MAERIYTKLQTIADNVQKVYNSGYTGGYSVGYNEGYDSGHEQGMADSPAHEEVALLMSIVDRTISGEFVIPDGWRVDTYTFAYTLITKLTVPNNIYMSGANGSYFAQMRVLEEVDWYPNGMHGYAFNNCVKLKTLRVHNKITWVSGNFVAGCTALENFLFNSTIKIANNNFDVSKNTLLTVESLLSILSALEDNTGGTQYTVKFGSTNLAKLTEEQKAIATNKNIALA